MESVLEYPTHTRQPPLEENVDGSVMHRALPAVRNGGAYPLGMPFSTQRISLSKGQNSEEPRAALDFFMLSRTMMRRLTQDKLEQWA